MVWPVAFPLEAFLTRAGITALGTAATSEGIKSLQNQGTVNPGVAKEAFMRTLMGPTTEILNRTTDTPSGKVFAPTGEVIESNQIPGMAPAEQPQGLPGLLIPQQEKQVEGMSQASPPTKDKGFTMPTTEDMSILYKVEDGEPKYKYPTEEEIKKYINEENEFWEQNAQRANEKYPELSSNNLPKLVEADKHFGAAAHSFQDFKNSKLIYMKPQEYLDLTRKFRPAEGEEKLGSKMNVKNIENILQQGKELANIPMLYVKKVGDSFEINGQEGIHRAKAFNNLGYDKIPVVIEGATKKEREELKDFIPSSIQSEDGEVLLTKPEDFYSVIDKKPLINKEQPTENVSTQDLTVENIQNKIKYKKSKEDKNITEAYLGDKKVGEIRKDMDSEKIGNQFNYTIHWTNEKGEIDYDDYNVETGFNSAKYTTALGLVNTIKSQEKEYLNKFIKAVENKDYDTLNKIREEEGGYDFEGSEFRSKEFKDTIDKYRPDLVKLSTKAYNEQQEAISELNTSKSAGSLIDKPLSDE